MEAFTTGIARPRDALRLGLADGRDGARFGAVWMLDGGPRLQRLVIEEEP
jgi:hypothetical protein